MFWDDWTTYAPDLLQGLGVSAQLIGIALAIGLPLGLVLAMFANSRTAIVRSSIVVLVEIGRGVPALVMLQILYFGLPSSGITLDALIAGGLALGLTTAAYSSEIIRGGLQAVPFGEIEAAQAMAMSRAHILRYIVVPQGLRICLPPLLGFCIAMFQATSLAYTISVPELLGSAYSIGSSTFRYLSILVLAGLFYAAITVPASLLVNSMESRLGKHQR
ncbi:MAG TPA: amino acid ABC transporter permease [Actinokineospora sp.]|nr:amino acid ABC transporter permease [Actinokineospora sp.]